MESPAAVEVTFGVRRLNPLRRQPGQQHSTPWRLSRKSRKVNSRVDRGAWPEHDAGTGARREPELLLSLMRFSLHYAPYRTQLGRALPH